MDRICFISKKVGKNFFNEVKESEKIGSWKRLGEILGTSRSMVKKYGCGGLSIPENRFRIMIEIIPKDKRKNYLSLIKKKKSNWGQVIGGKEAYKINKKGFERGRKIGAKVKSNNPKYKFDINLKISEDLCEFIGAIIGDGFTNRYGNLYQTQITGDKDLDFAYYHKRLKPICERLFNIIPKISERRGALRLNIYSKRLFEMLTQRFKIPARKKCYTVTIPKEIINSKKHLISAVLRGMFDTDGEIVFDKRKRYNKPYVRIQYSSISKELTNQVSTILSRLSIKHSTHKPNKRKSHVVTINGRENCKKFVENIGFSNPRHSKKIDGLWVMGANPIRGLKSQ
ncbi:MAG: hypothetical protein KKB31_02470 [Nanoarchaeota archaeon]|nr:hypothetical protein [Nanoarchaeota archaeon]